MNVSNPSPVGLQNYASIDRKHTFCTINTVRKTKLQIFQYIMASVSFSFPRRTSSKQNLLSVTDPHHSNEGESVTTHPGWKYSIPRIVLSVALVAYGIFDCVSDWKLYCERDSQIEDICKEASTEIHSSTKHALKAMLAFAIFGTILISLETINFFLGLCKQKIMHPVFLSIIVCLFEELPLAVLRWNLKTSANNKMADGWGIASSIGGMTAPLLGPIYKCCKMSDCCKSKSSCCSGEKDETCCDDLCSGTSGWFGVTFLVLMVLVVVTINILNWANFEAPGAELCVQE
ncbi:uncharacterized protein LOC114522882 isoform X1 [Dendronephthya gigantea]|uniref:uncharacterized protein LOC114522882 isoform X1 n=1 Tax=Dendronephthya gigantea TaxID=151771 RepID=UPI00106CE922|nr:uncharacterized protein LOC114522882 isoform X1 [Dendronephthya gigantea]